MMDNRKNSDGLKSGGTNLSDKPIRHKMTMSERAKQFAPFSALIGLEAAIAAKEAEHSREEKPELSEDVLNALNQRISDLYVKDFAKVTYFTAGKYLTVCGEVESIDSHRRVLVVAGTEIHFKDICKLSQVNVFRKTAAPNF